MSETEEKILGAALKVFVNEGYAHATIQRIAQEANITETTLLEKFQSKETFLKEVLRKKIKIHSLNAGMKHIRAYLYGILIILNLFFRHL
jgi:AcrR family transcriptional regulator